VQDVKKALRARLRAEIRALSDEERAVSDEAIFQNLVALPEYRAAETVFAYWSVGNEVSTRRLLRHALTAGKRLALPVIHGKGEMGFRRMEGALVTGRFYDIPEPPESAEALTPRPGDILIVPALCYDRALYRLGQGGGYYDRILARYEDVFSAGVCREGLLLDSVPRESHDRAVDCLVTEKGAARPQ
jgi:5-formyltetrahydrofolate cyclo-ligase